MGATVLWLAAAPWLLFPELAPSLIAAALLALLASRGWIWLAYRRPLVRTPLDWPIALFLGLSLLSYALSPVPEVSFPKLMVLLLGASAFYLVQDWAAATGGIGGLLVALAAAGGAVATVALFALEWPSRQVVDMTFLTDRLPHLTGSLAINGNEVAGTLVLLVPFAAALVGRPGRPWQRSLALISLALAAVVLVLTQSRAAGLGLIVAGLAWYGWGRWRPRVLWAAMAAYGVAIVLLLLLARQERGAVRDWLALMDGSSKSGDAISWLGRLEIWRAAGSMLADYPVFGAGLYAFEPVSRANYVYQVVSPVAPIAHPHNLVLEAGTSLGWAGMILMAGIWVVTLTALWQAARGREGALARQGAILGTAASAYLAFNLFDAVTLGQKPGVLVWLVLAGSMAVARLASPEPAAAARALRPARLWPLAAAALLLALAVTPLGTRNLAYLRLDYAVLEGGASPKVPAVADLGDDTRRLGLAAWQRGDPGEALAFWAGDPGAADFLTGLGAWVRHERGAEEALPWLDLAARAGPRATAAYYYRGLAHQDVGALPEARADLETALMNAAGAGVDDAFEARVALALGEVLERQGALGEAATAFRRATALAPHEAYYYLRLGNALLRLGDQAGADAAYGRAEQGG